MYFVSSWSNDAGKWLKFVFRSISRQLCAVANCVSVGRNRCVRQRRSGFVCHSASLARGNSIDKPCRYVVAYSGLCWPLHVADCVFIAAKQRRVCGEVVATCVVINHRTVCDFGQASAHLSHVLCEGNTQCCPACTRHRALHFVANSHHHNLAHYCDRCSTPFGRHICHLKQRSDYHNGAFVFV